jgi:8-oxo-dGTP pyrophosphatase MutT (NUDIX family)
VANADTRHAPGEQDDMSDATRPAIDAATVVIAHDTPGGIEVLMVRKNSKLHFGGMWVFPGGRVDAQDRAGGLDAIEAFRRAAVREAMEEAGVDLSGCELTHISHWLPPASRPKRFSTHFFITRAPADLKEVIIDGGEITDHGWTTPKHALERRHRGEIEMVTPTFVTLDWLRRYSRLDAALADVTTPRCFHTRMVKVADGQVALYEGDAAYDSLDLTQPGPRRRANMSGGEWWWEEHDGDGAVEGTG